LNRNSYAPPKQLALWAAPITTRPGSVQELGPGDGGPLGVGERRDGLRVNPYGRFRLDMDTRLDLTAA
jgi:hypothetical protein